MLEKHRNFRLDDNVTGFLKKHQSFSSGGDIMQHTSIWKRVGGWLRRSHKPQGGSQVVNLDAEGLLINSQDHDESDSDTSSALFTRQSKKDQLAAVEDGFNRLVDVLESINDNVSQQRKENSQLNDKLAGAVDSLQVLPDSFDNQKEVFKNITQEIKNQTFSQQQLAELLSSLPDNTQTQTEKLEEITRNLQNSHETQLQQVEVFNRFDGSVKNISQSSQAQASSVANIGQMLQQSQQQLQDTFQHQNRRFTWFFGALVALAGLLIAALALIVWLIMRGPAQT